MNINTIDVSRQKSLRRIYECTIEKKVEEKSNTKHDSWYQMQFNNQM